MHKTHFFDVAVVGGGMAGLATAARLQAAGLRTLVLEAHGLAGGCAGYYRRKGFSFDVGATTLVDFESNGVGAELLQAIGMPPLAGDILPGYTAWLPDRKVHLYRDRRAWQQERRLKLGDSGEHRKFWRLMDRLADVFWRASRRGIRLPLQSFADCLHAVKCIGVDNIALSRFARRTMGDTLNRFGLGRDNALRGLLGMLIEDTVHSTVDKAPLINAALGISIRAAGLTRARGGMRGFWQAFSRHYRRLGGCLKTGCAVKKIGGREGAFFLETRRGVFCAGQVVSAVPVELTARLGGESIAGKLGDFIERDRPDHGGALMLALGVPAEEVEGREFSHHQLMHSYTEPLGNGNNMFISVSAQGDTESAPAGYRSVMISTHCDLSDWTGLSDAEYIIKKDEARERLLTLARRAYPRLGSKAVLTETATPRTYERFTRRPFGAVGGVRQNLSNTNQQAVPHDCGLPGFWLAGDTTWPGLGTVACVLGSRIVAQKVLERHPKPLRTLRIPTTGAKEENNAAHAFACA